MIKETADALLSLSGNSLILPHISPDGDTIGSTVAMYHALKRLGKSVYLINDDRIADDFAFLADGIAISSEQFKALNCSYQNVISIDASDVERLGDRAELLIDKCVINIDHHRTNSMFGTLNCVDQNAAAAGEVVFRVLKQMNVALTPQIAEALYVAIVTDTGSFKYGSTTSDTMRIAAELFDVPFDRERVVAQLYYNIRREKMNLHIHALQRTTYYCDGRIALCYLSLDDFKKYNALQEYSEGLVENVRNISGVEVVVFLKQKLEDEIKFSMRSIGDIDVSAIAFEHGGGGHKNAAGFSLKASLDEALHYSKTKLLEEIAKCMGL